MSGANSLTPDDLTELNDTGQRYEVTYYDRRELRRKVCGWTDDAARARKIGDMWDGMDRCIQIHDRSISEQSQTPPTSKSVNLTDEQIQRYDADSRIELIAECERLRAAVNEGAMGCCQIVKEDMTAEIERLKRENAEFTSAIVTEALAKDRLRAVLQAFMDFQVTDYYRQAGGAKAYCELRRAGRKALSEASSANETAAEPLPCYWPKCDCKRAIHCQSRPSEKAGGDST